MRRTAKATRASAHPSRRCPQGIARAVWLNQRGAELIRLLLLAAFLGLLFYGGRWLWRNWAPRLAGQWHRVALYAGAAALLLLAATGRLGLLLAAVGAAVAYASRLLPQLLRWAPVLHRLWQQAGGQGSMETAYLRMRMDYAGGAVLAGSFAGRQLGELSLDRLLALYGELQSADAASAALLEAYLDRRHGKDWRRVSATGGDSGNAPPRGGKMSREEAGKVLGLPPDASNQEIIAAHRRLMQKFHPDRGGSDYLATKINLAKDVLLKK